MGLCPDVTQWLAHKYHGDILATSWLLTLRCPITQLFVLIAITISTHAGTVSKDINADSNLQRHIFRSFSKYLYSLIQSMFRNINVISLKSLSVNFLLLNCRFSVQFSSVHHIFEDIQEIKLNTSFNDRSIENFELIIFVSQKSSAWMFCFLSSSQVVSFSNDFSFRPRSSFCFFLNQLR